MIEMNWASGARVITFTLASLFGACKTESASPVEPMYRELLSDRAAVASDVEEEDACDARQAARCIEVHRIIDEHGLSTATDHWMAAVVLVESDQIEDLVVAGELAHKAGEMGAPIGFRIEAEALDKELVKRGMHQRYGTQFYFDVLMQSWRLYPVDPRTTDEERHAMGVASLEELHRDEERLNGR